MSHSDLTVFDLVEIVRGAHPNVGPTLTTVLRTIVLPTWKLPRCRGEKFDDLLRGQPAHRLYSLLDGTKARWCQDLARKLPPGNTYQRAYPRLIRRLISLGEREGILHPDHHAIAPEWWTILQAADHLLPAHRLDANGRWALRRLARWATGAGVLPKAIPRLGADGRMMSDFRATFPPGGEGGFYQARKIWNAVVASGSDLALSIWPAQPRDSIAALPRSAWPPVVTEGFSLLLDRDGLGTWKPDTRQGYALRLGSYLGVLAQLGVDPHALLLRVPDGRSTIRLLFQGLPDRLRGIDEHELARCMIAEPGFTATLLSDMAAYEGHHDGKACVPNPFVVAAVRAYASREKFTSGIDLLAKAAALNRGFLGITERHVAWLGPQLKTLEQLARRNPSNYTTKKRRVFRHPDLWRRLVSARHRLRERTLALEAEGRSGWHQRRWAVALRNEVMFGLLLCYPLRVGNLVAIEIGRHYDPDTYGIYFPAEETKNEREIDYELPDGGALGDLRGLIDRYLKAARPVLLDGRRSPHLFVPGPSGGTRCRSRAVNEILVNLSREFFADVLPSGIEALNPHLLRHAAATFQLVHGGGLNLAAQMLNDSPATISKSYADVLESRKEATKRFLSNFDL